MGEHLASQQHDARCSQRCRRSIQRVLRQGWGPGGDRHDFGRRGWTWQFRGTRSMVLPKEGTVRSTPTHTPQSTAQAEELVFPLRAVPTPPTAGTQLLTLASRKYFSFLLYLWYPSSSASCRRTLVDPQRSSAGGGPKRAASCTPNWV